METPENCFHILAIAPLVPGQSTVWTEGCLRVDKNNLDEIIAHLKPSFQITVPKEISPTGLLEIEINRLKGFHPDSLIKDQPFLADLCDAKAFLETARSKGLGTEQIRNKLKEWPDLPPIAIVEEKSPSSKKTQPGVDDILKLVSLPDGTNGKKERKGSEVRQINHILHAAISHIFMDKNFRRCESVWRGVRLLLSQDRGNAMVSVALFPATRETLAESLDNLSIQLIDQPPSLVVVDLPFDNSPWAIENLGKIGQLGETVLAPAVCAVGPSFFYLEGWDQLDRLPYLPHYLDGQPYAKWRNLTTGSAGRWLAITCNGFVSRYPYGPENQTRVVSFQEQDIPWSSPVWSMSSLIAQSVYKTGWPTSFSRWQDIRIEDLPLPSENPAGSYPTEFQLDQERITQFIEAGIMPLMGKKNKDFIFTPADKTISGEPLSYHILVARISHFILWCKDNLGEHITPDTLQQNLKNAFALFWEKTGHPAPENLTIDVGAKRDGGRIPITISLVPSRQILSRSHPVELEFLW